MNPLRGAIGTFYGEPDPCGLGRLARPMVPPPWNPLGDPKVVMDVLGTCDDAADDCVGWPVAAELGAPAPCKNTLYTAVSHRLIADPILLRDFGRRFDPSFDTRTAAMDCCDVAQVQVANAYRTMNGET